MPSPLDIIKTMTDAMAIKDYDAALPWFTDDCEYTNLPMGSVTGRAQRARTLFRADGRE